MNFAPAAFVATFPPIELEDDDDKEIGNNLLFSSAKAFASSVIAPAWHLICCLSANHSILFILSREITISFCVAVAPPHRPVLPPDGTIG